MGVYSINESLGNRISGVANARPPLNLPSGFRPNLLEEQPRCWFHSKQGVGREDDPALSRACHEAPC
ncbi:hypothetical protein CDAR_401481 [Caerostris darwini]|uniref:Uncharacterized protein n=1 Tax=Caerostris darwini TaxID=1538125 RepID=A0AAV4RSY2_9ARAC|nr:hypothetical protein CDAR_401481 [Caerostris darwini]